MEAKLVPYQVSPVPSSAAVLVFAPHPDDEVFGPGGLLALYAQAGTPVHMIVVTDGGLGGHTDTPAGLIATRINESCRAAQLLGLSPPDFWGIPDRCLLYGEPMIERIMAAIRERGCDLVVCPALSEMHPDHRALAMAVVEAVRRLALGLRVLMYEVGVPIPSPNLLIDITAVRDLKQQAMAVFLSQQDQQDYAGKIAALNVFRTYTLARQVVAAEAYCLWDSAAQATPWDAFCESEYLRQRRLGLPLIGHCDFPLVSILIRSTARATLAKALDSIALQTYPNIEVVLVNALGEGHFAPESACGRFPLRFAEKREAGRAVRLRRAEAANRALDSASGDWLLFLDDDDWLEPGHIAKLCAATAASPEVMAANTGVACIFPEGKHSGIVFDARVDPVALSASNQLPIHSVLFSRQLLAKGCRFDESLDQYEDWDFWLQVSELTAFAYSPGVSAYYFLAGDSGVHEIRSVHDEAQARILRKWHARWSDRQVRNVAAWIREAQAQLLSIPGLNAKVEDLALSLRHSNEAAQARENALLGELAQNREEAVALNLAYQQQLTQVAALQEALRQHHEKFDEIRHQLDLVYASRSWRILGWARALVNLFRR